MSRNTIVKEKKFSGIRRAGILLTPKLLSTTRTSDFTRRRRKTSRQIPRFPLTKQQLEDLREAFNIFDPKGTGFITVSELRIAIRALGYEPRTSELEDMVAMVDNSGKGRIAYADFEYLMNLRMAKIDRDSDTLKAMYLMNGGKDNGLITLEKLKQVSVELGEDLNDDELLEMLNAADMNFDAAIDPKEFLAITKKLPNLRKNLA